MLAIPSSYRLLGLRAAVDEDVSLVELEVHFAGDVLLCLADEGHQGVHLGRVPEAVVDHLGHFRREAVAQVHQVTIERELLHEAMGIVEDRHAGRLVHAAALHADEAVLDHVDPPDAVAAADGVQLLHDVVARPAPCR